MCFLRYAGDGATTKRRFRRWNIVIVSLLAFLVLGAFVANHPSYLVPQRTAITLPPSGLPVPRTQNWQLLSQLAFA